jgi:hypothetical protein
LADTLCDHIVFNVRFRMIYYEMIDNIKLALIREILIDFFEITESLIVNGSFIKK